jgi:K+-sensing histidine kinase KdpD
VHVRGSTLLRYGLAVATPALALGIDVTMPRVFMPEPFMMFYIAVLVSAWYGGWGPGALATMLSGTAVETFVITPFEAVDASTCWRSSPSA